MVEESTQQQEKKAAKHVQFTLDDGIIVAPDKSADLSDLNPEFVAGKSTSTLSLKEGEIPLFG